MIVLLLLSLFCLEWGLPPVLHAEVRHESLAPRGNFVPKDPAFKSITRSLKSLNFRKAIQETKDLNRNHKTPKIVEAAAFLIGDLYLTLAEREHPRLFQKALNAYREATGRYPKSKRTAPSLMRMGMIFSREAFYYEAIATFDRIIKKYPNSAYVFPAQINKGRAYFQWKKYDKAITAFDKINTAILSQQESTILRLNYANIYYLKKEYQTAFGYYKLISPQDPILQNSKKALYQYGISAYQSEAHTDSRELLFILNNKYPKTTYSLLALARIGDSLRIQGKIPQAKKTYQQVYAVRGRQYHRESANLIAAIGEFHIAGCAPVRPKSFTSLCFKGRALNTEPGRLAYDKIRHAVDKLLSRKKKRPHLVDRLILETATALEQHEMFPESLKIKKTLIKQKITKPLKEMIEKLLPQTAIASINQFFEKGDDIEALNIYYSNQDYFSEVLKGSTGLNLGIALVRLELYQEAIDLLSPIARHIQKEKAGQREKALFYLVTTYYKQEKYVTAERQRQLFIKEYPKSGRIPHLQHLSAKASFTQGKTKLAIKKFSLWLARYAKSSERTLVLMDLGDAYLESKDLNQALESYLKIEESKQKMTSGLYLKIADTFFKLKNYKKSISFYTKTITVGKEDEAVNWASFQVAQSYEKLGMRDKGHPIYSRLETKSQGIIRVLSEQKAVELSKN